MSTGIILDRLQACNGEITAIDRVFRLSPTKPIMPSDLPCLYMLAPREMTQPIPRTSPGRYLVIRRYPGRLLVAVSTGAALDSNNAGAKILTDAVPFLDRIVDYYAAHPRLHTATLGELDGISDDVTIQDAGISEGIIAPGGPFVGINFILTIEESRTTARSFT